MALPRQQVQTMEVVRGATKEWAFVALDENQEPINLTGATARFIAKRSIADADADAVITKSEADGITIAAGASGLATLKVLGSDTAGLEDARVVLSFEIVVTIGGNPYPVAMGVMLIYPGAYKGS